NSWHRRWQRDALPHRKAPDGQDRSGWGLLPAALWPPAEPRAGYGCPAPDPHTQGGQAVLGLAEEITAAACFQVVLGHGETVGGIAEKTQPCPHGVILVIRNQDAAGIRRAAPYPAAQLVQGRQTETFGVFDDHDRCIGHIHAHLDY